MPAPGIRLKQVECWDQQAMTVYNDKPWSTAENVPPGDPPGTGNPDDYCPAIPAP